MIEAWCALLGVTDPLAVSIAKGAISAGLLLYAMWAVFALATVAINRLVRRYG